MTWGSGDGRLVIKAAQNVQGHAVGIEIVRGCSASRRKKDHHAASGFQVKIVHANALKVDLSPAECSHSVAPDQLDARLKPNLEKYLKPSAPRSLAKFGMPGWKANPHGDGFTPIARPIPSTFMR